MKPIEMITLVLAFCLAGAHAFAVTEKEKKDYPNAEKRLGEPPGNASVLIGTGKGTGTPQKDTRPKGKRVNEDYSDTDVKDKD